MNFSIQSDFPEVAKKLRQLSDDVAKQATARALNRTMEQAKTAMSREIRANYAMSAATVNAALSIRRASLNGGRLNLEASIYPVGKRGRSQNLANFQARQTTKGVTFKVKKDGPRQLIPHSFLINGGKTVMIRTTKDRLPIKALQTIDVAQMFNTKRINAKVVEVIKLKFPEIFEREAKYYTDKFNSR